MPLVPPPSNNGQQLLTRQRHGLGRALLVDQLFVARLFAGVNQPGVVIGDQLMGIPQASVFRTERIGSGGSAHWMAFCHFGNSLLHICIVSAVLAVRDPL